MRARWILLSVLFVGIGALGCGRGLREGIAPERPSAVPTTAGGARGTGPRERLSSPVAAEEGSSEEVIPLEGVIEGAFPGGYQVASVRVRVAPEMDAEGPLPRGVYVRVLGVRLPDGSLQAEAFEVLRRPEAAGEWQGPIQELFPDGYRVNGRRVFVLSTTAVIGTPQVGVEVYLSGFEQPDGSILADSVIVLEPEEP